jgi:hypothetical protein
MKEIKTKHLWWIIPVCLLVGGLGGLKSMQWFFDMTAWELTETVTVILNDCIVAWEEEPLSNERVYFDTEFCYNVNNETVCPKRTMPYPYVGKEVKDLVDMKNKQCFMRCLE